MCVVMLPKGQMMLAAVRSGGMELFGEAAMRRATLRKSQCIIYERVATIERPR